MRSDRLAVRIVAEVTKVEYCLAGGSGQEEDGDKSVEKESSGKAYYGHYAAAETQGNGWTVNGSKKEMVTEDDDDIVLLTADVLRESRSKDELTEVDPEDDIILLFAEMRRGHYS